MSILMSATWS